jgi:hypothetical protein
VGRVVIVAVVLGVVLLFGYCMKIKARKF